MNRSVLRTALACLLWGIAQEASGQDLAASFKAQVKPLLDKHCVECHGADVQEAGLRLDTLGIALHDDATMGTWVRVHDKLVAGEMPPSDQPRPPQRVLDAATQW